MVLACAAVLLVPAAAAAQTAHTVDDDPNSPYGPDDRVVALTFDDGPNPDDTPAILQTLHRYGVPATFFVVGQWGNQHTGLLDDIHQHGHTVANHTWSHPQFPHLPDLSDDEVHDEIASTRDLISDVTGQGPHEAPSCMRPPGGVYDDRVVSIASDLGYRTALWTVSTGDYEQPGADVIVDRALEGLEPGAVILLHDGPEDRQQTAEALPHIIEGIHDRGYEIVPWCRPPPPFQDDIWESGVHAAAIEQLEARGITTGVTEDRYEPGGDTTRGHVASFLWRTAGEPAGHPDHGFEDVASGAHYEEAVRWMADEGITEGVTATEYRPHQATTRGQMAALIWRKAGEPTGYPDHGFEDVASGVYYDQALRWMVAEGISEGYGDRFAPDRSVTRAQTASLLMRAFGS